MRSISQSHAMGTGQSSPRLATRKNTANQQRSSFDSAPGDEFPAAVYRSIVFAFAWMMLAAWLAFGGATGIDLDLAIATVLFVVFLALPIIIHRTASNQLQSPHLAPRQFLESHIDIATGAIFGREAWLQVILIPVALALAATLIGGVFVIMS